MNHYERLRRKRLGDLLVDEEVASKEAVITALHEHHQSAQPISQVLINGGELREYDLARVVVEQYQLPFLDLTSYSYDRDLIQKFPGHVLHQAGIIPLDQFGDIVTFAVQELPSDEVMEELKRHAGETVSLYAAMSTEIRQALQEHVKLGDEAFAASAAAAQEAGAPVAANMSEDGAWQELFDTANESIVSGGLVDDDDIGH